MDLPKEAVEAGERAAWEARRIHAHDANGFMLEAWGDGTVPRQNGITQEIEAVLRAALPHIQAAMLREMMVWVKRQQQEVRVGEQTPWPTSTAMLRAYAAEHNIPMDQEKEIGDAAST